MRMHHHMPGMQAIVPAIGCQATVRAHAATLCNNSVEYTIQYQCAQIRIICTLKLQYQNRLDWDGSNENEIYLEYIANILMEKKPLKTSVRKNYEGKKPT